MLDEFTSPVLSVLPFCKLNLEVSFPLYLLSDHTTFHLDNTKLIPARPACSMSTPEMNSGVSLLDGLYKDVRTGKNTDLEVLVPPASGVLDGQCDDLRRP